MRIRSLIIPILFLVVIALSGCGGGGGGDTQGTTLQPDTGITGNPTDTPAPAPTSGLLKLSTSGTAVIMAGIDATVDLPAGVILDADPVTGETTAGVVSVSGEAAVGSNNLAVAKYAPASIGVPAKLHIALINGTGFRVGEFATVQFNLATDAIFPASSAFTVTSFSAKGLDGSTLGGVIAAPSTVAGI